MAIRVDGKGICEIDGIKYPAVGFGTYPLHGDVCYKAVTQAGELGYRIIDTATLYGNFVAIGNALKILGRKNFYIISKVWPDAQTPERMQKDLKTTLTQLQTTYLDAYLLHWPNSKVPIESSLNAMENLRVDGMIRHIGLSNVTANHLKRALESNIPISWVQVEMSPLFYDAELLKLCQEKLITVQAWCPLGRGRVNDDADIKSLGEKYGKTPAQIGLKWIIQHQCIPLPGSTNAEHMKQNMGIGNFMLAQEDMEAINDKAKSGQRQRITKANGMGFEDEFDFSYEECWPHK